MASPDRLQRGSSAEVIARHLRTAIEARQYCHGQQLPSTRALASEWGTSVATVTRAMQTLTAEGIVVARDRSSRVVHYPPGDRDRPTDETPAWIVVGGYAGSGKTEFGRIMARLTGWPIFDKDTATRPILEAALDALGESPHDRESDTYLTTMRPAEYEGLRSLTAENLACGNSSIMTAPFVKELSDPGWTNGLVADAEAMGASLHVVWMRCDVESMRTYLIRRGAARDTYKLAHWDEFAASLDRDYSPALPYSVVENSLGSATLQDQARMLLRSWKAGAGTLPQ